MLDVVAGVVLRVSNRCWVEQVDQFSKALALAVMRRSAGENERVGVWSQRARKLVSQTGPVHHVVAFVDDNRVPLNAFEMVPVTT